MRFPILRIHYWEEDLFSMGKALGRLVGIDRNTRNRMVGRFARIQVDMAVGGERPNEIMVEHKFWMGFSFQAEG